MRYVLEASLREGMLKIVCKWRVGKDCDETGEVVSGRRHCTRALDFGVGDDFNGCCRDHSFSCARDIRLSRPMY